MPFRHPLVLALVLAVGGYSALPAATLAKPSVDAQEVLTKFQLSNKIIFTKGSSELSPAAKEALAALVNSTLKADSLSVDIFGFSDTQGGEAVNLSVSLARAQAVQDYLLSQGLTAERIGEVKGLGTKDPLADNATEEGRQMNRRVEIHVAGGTLQGTRQAVEAPAQLSRTAAVPAVVEEIHASVSQTAAVPTDAEEITAPKSQTSEPTSTHPTRFALGVGYPDARLRMGLGEHWNVEAKGAFAAGLQIYSGRLSWNFLSIGPLKALVGGEGGYVKFDGVENISGNGNYGQTFLGLEYPFAGRLRVSLDVGPTWMNASSEGQAYTTTEIVYNTALYLYIW